jgi:DNA-damage-inducible protein J
MTLTIDLPPEKIIALQAQALAEGVSTEQYVRRGLSVFDAVRMLLVRVAAEKSLPFEVKVPNATAVEGDAGRRYGQR